MKEITIQYLKSLPQIWTNTLDNILLNNLTTYIVMWDTGITNKGRLRQWKHILSG
mgnify:CR=1 FL=1